MDKYGNFSVEDFMGEDASKIDISKQVNKLREQYRNSFNFAGFAACMEAYAKAYESITLKDSSGSYLSSESQHVRNALDESFMMFLEVFQPKFFVTTETGEK